MVTSDTRAKHRGKMYANSGNIKLPKTFSIGKYIHMETDSFHAPMVTVWHSSAGFGFYRPSAYKPSTAAPLRYSAY